MKTKAAKQPKRSDTKMKDIKPKKDVRGGRTTGTAYASALIVDPDDPNR
jgi:hypothetical protein